MFTRRKGEGDAKGVLTSSCLFCVNVDVVRRFSRNGSGSQRIGIFEIVFVNLYLRGGGDPCILPAFLPWGLYLRIL